MALQPNRDYSGPRYMRPLVLCSVAASALLLCGPAAARTASDTVKVGLPKSGDFVLANFWVTAKGVPASNDAKLRAKFTSLPSGSAPRLHAHAFAGHNGAKTLQGRYAVRVIGINPIGGRDDLPSTAKLKVTGNARKLRVHHARHLVVLDGYLERAGLPLGTIWRQQVSYCSGSYSYPRTGKAKRGLRGGPWGVAGAKRPRALENMYQGLVGSACRTGSVPISYLQSLGLDWPPKWNCTANFEFFSGPGAGAAAGATVRGLRLRFSCQHGFTNAGVSLGHPYGPYPGAWQRRLIQSPPQYVEEITFDRDMNCDDVGWLRIGFSARELPMVTGWPPEPPTVVPPPGC